MTAWGNELHCRELAWQAPPLCELGARSVLITPARPAYFYCWKITSLLPLSYELTMSKLFLGLLVILCGLLS